MGMANNLGSMNGGMRKHAGVPKRNTPIRCDLKFPAATRPNHAARSGCVSMAALIEQIGEGAEENHTRENGEHSNANEGGEPIQPLLGFFHEFDELQEAHIEDESESASGGTVLF